MQKTIRITLREMWRVSGSRYPDTWNHKHADGQTNRNTKEAIGREAKHIYLRRGQRLRHARRLDGFEKHARGGTGRLMEWRGGGSGGKGGKSMQSGQERKSEWLQTKCFGLVPINMVNISSDSNPKNMEFLCERKRKDEYSSDWLTLD